MLAPIDLFIPTAKWVVRPSSILCILAWTLFAISATIPKRIQRLIIALETGPMLLRNVLVLIGLLSDALNREEGTDRRLMEQWIRRMASISRLTSERTETMVRASYLLDVARLQERQRSREAISRKAGGVSEPEDEKPLLDVGVLVLPTMRDLSANFANEMLSWGDVGKIIRHTQERWDGTGYPDRLVGEAIPLESWILAIVEAFVSQLSATTETDSALGYIKDREGTQFDPRRVAEFERLIQPS